MSFPFWHKLKYIVEYFLFLFAFKHCVNHFRHVYFIISASVNGFLCLLKIHITLNEHFVAFCLLFVSKMWQQSCLQIDMMVCFVPFMFSHMLLPLVTSPGILPPLSSPVPHHVISVCVFSLCVPFSPCPVIVCLCLFMLLFMLLFMVFMISGFWCLIWTLIFLCTLSCLYVATLPCCFGCYFAFCPCFVCFWFLYSAFVK